MATVTLAVGTVFPVGTTVNARKRSNWPAYLQDQPVGTPGSADTSAAVQSDGRVTFVGLAAKTRYIAHANVSGSERYVQFQVGDGGPELAQAIKADTDFVGPTDATFVDVSGLSLSGVVCPAAIFVELAIQQLANTVAGQIAQVKIFMDGSTEIFDGPGSTTPQAGVSYRAYRSGLVPGSSHDFKVQISRTAFSSSGSAQMYVAAGHPAVLTVKAA